MIPLILVLDFSFTHSGFKSEPVFFSFIVSSIPLAASIDFNRHTMVPPEHTMLSFALFKLRSHRVTEFSEMTRVGVSHPTLKSLLGLNY